MPDDLISLNLMLINCTRPALIALFAFCSIPYLQAQQNLFNAPSGDITHTKKFFYQHQLNLYSDQLESKAHFVYGLAKNWDVGVNLVGKGFYFSDSWRLKYNDSVGSGALYPILMGTVQRAFHFSEKFQLNVGTQMGVNLSTKLKNKELCYFLYGLGVYHFAKGSRAVMGVYSGNEMFLGEGQTTGIILGYELKLSKRFYLMGDWLSGNNDGSVAVVGGMYNVSKRIQLCAGWQIPNPQTPKPMALVLELNILGWNIFEAAH
jgi:hypothetical protein